MRKNKLAAGVAAIIMILLLTGCGSKFPSMTREQENAVGEYAAMVLLKYDANNRSRLVSYEEVEAREQELLKKQRQQDIIREQQEANNNTSTENTAQVTNANTVESMEALLGFPEGVTILYTGNEISDSYPTGGGNSDFFSLDAAEGKQLLVLKFNLENQSQESKMVDLLSKTINYRITVNGDYTRSALVTMLDDNLSTYRSEIAAGNSTGAVLLMEVDESIATGISSVSLNLRSGTDRYTIQLQ